jgi:recombination protein RecA
MRAAFSKAEIESEISSRFGSAFKIHEKRPAEITSTGIPQIDGFIEGGLPRGAITEIFGHASSGRTTFLLSSLAHATMQEEVCALIDTNDVFDPQTASQAGINLERLLWVRCHNNLEHAFKAADLILQAGGFGVVILDLGDVPAKSAKRIISSWWYRFRRTLEATSTAMIVITEESCVGSRAALAFELNQEKFLWSTPVQTPASSQPRHGLSVISRKRVAKARQPELTLYPHANLLRGLAFQVESRRPLYLKGDGDVRIRASGSF